MVSQQADSAAPASPRQFRFDAFVFDVGAGRLLRHGAEISLRPKSFAVLRHLVENPGRLIPKEELFAAIWPNIAVTDDVLVQSIGEVRRALGEDGARLLRTVPRRGYRLDVACEAVQRGSAESAEALPEANASLLETAVTPPPRGSLGTRLSFARSLPIAGMALLALLAMASTYLMRERAETTSSSVVRAIEPQRSSAAISGRPAIAILPFVDHEGTSYFADGLTQDIINSLGRFSALTVMSWNAVLAHKGKPVESATIGRELAVRYYVEGKVQQSGERVRVTAQLASTDGRVLWSDRFDEARKDVFDLQDKIITQIAGALAIRVTEIERRRSLAKPTESLEAYDHVLRAWSALQRPSRAGNVEARALLKRALELDQNYAAAHAALAETHYIDVSMGWAQSPATALERAEAEAVQAVNIDPSEIRARVVLGRIHILHQRYEQARQEIERAIAINPSDAQSLAGRGNILMWLGDVDAAIEALELAQRIDPELTTIDRFALSLAYYLNRRYAAAIAQAELNLRATADANFSRVVLAAAYAQANQDDDAARVVTALRRLDPTFDPQSFGTKFLNPSNLEHVREGLRKARL